MSHTQHLLPSSFNADFASSVHTQAAPGQAQGVYIVLHPNVLDDIVGKIEQWFDTRPEVSVVDVGTSDKQGLGFIILEWMECAIDPLFLAILQSEEFISDYTTYARHLHTYGKGY